MAIYQIPKPQVLTGLNQLMVTINPFDNFIKLNIFGINGDTPYRRNLNDYTSLKMTVKGPKTDIDFPVFRESPDNDFERGVAVFWVSESKYSDLVSVSKKNFNVFYINGVDVFGNRQIIYSGFYKIWTSVNNIRQLETEFKDRNSELASLIIQKSPVNSDNTGNGTQSDTSTDDSGLSKGDKIVLDAININDFKPRYRASNFAIYIGILFPNPRREDWEFVPVSDLRGTLNSYNWFAVDIMPTGVPSAIDETKNPDYLYTKSDLQKLFPWEGVNKQFDETLFLRYAQAYFKGLNIKPTREAWDNWVNSKELSRDFRKYIMTKPIIIDDVIRKEFLPVSPVLQEYFKKNFKIELRKSVVEQKLDTTTPLVVGNAGVFSKSQVTSREFEENKVSNNQFNTLSSSIDASLRLQFKLEFNPYLGAFGDSPLSTPFVSNSEDYNGGNWRLETRCTLIDINSKNPTQDEIESLSQPLDYLGNVSYQISELPKEFSIKLTSIYFQSKDSISFYPQYDNPQSLIARETASWGFGNQLFITQIVDSILNYPANEQFGQWYFTKLRGEFAKPLSDDVYNKILQGLKNYKPIVITLKEGVHFTHITRNDRLGGIQVLRSTK